jgi:coenzyme F420H2 oxidase
MHHSTHKMALALAEGLIAGGADVAMHFLHVDERSEVVKDILDNKIVLLDAPTLHGGPYPNLDDLVHYLRRPRFNKTGQKKLAVTFGSM